MSKARLYFDGDNTGIEKNARAYSLTQSIEDKLDSIDGLETTLQGEIDDLQDQINNLASRGRYLSTWDAVTGLPNTNPSTSPYTYRAGDYYIVSNVGTTNYRPTGSSYTTGVASQVVETETLRVNDLYIYDGNVWVRQGSSMGVSVPWGTIVGNIADQTDLQNALDAKANRTDVLEKTNTTSYTPTADYHPATKKYVDDNDTYIGTSAPTNNVVEGRLWYDTTNDILKVYNGSQWVPTGKTYTAGSHINITSADVISTWGLQEELVAGDNITFSQKYHPDTQGPCPDGFHVPTEGQFIDLYNICTSLGISINNLSGGIMDYLKLPMSQSRLESNGTIYTVTTLSAYWTCNVPGPYSRYSEVARMTHPEEARFLNYSRSNGCVIRPFKNTPSIPDNNWVVVFDGSSIATGAGIFHNVTEGLLSLSDDGNTWMTIADKNLGATIVYNFGDTVSESNCGKYYQWGNNYGFDGIGGNNPTTSSTAVNASGYGPGHYYYNNNFITVRPRDTSNNLNLWGGQTNGTRYEPVISAANTTYTAGTGINIDANNEISVDTSVVATKTELNTKTFHLTGTSDLTTAQEIFDWWAAGNTPIIKYQSSYGNYFLGKLDSNSTTNNILTFYLPKTNVQTYSSKSEYDEQYIEITVVGGNVTNIQSLSDSIGLSFLATDTNYSTPYTPAYDGSPATKKYVDDKTSTLTVTLASANWSNNSITVTATGVTASNTVIISPAPANINDYASNSIYCSAQGTDSLTFSCSTVPSGDIDVNVVVLN